uniref:Uncharacterized protein n=1 Tax=Aegilops tauschii subsp. strangulata TaxID=200361 RepID=A0A453IKA2_AEGTS
MITRAKLVEQLREHQIRSAQSYSAALAVFSPNPHIASRAGPEGGSPLCLFVLFSHGVVLCCTLPEMVQALVPLYRPTA